MKQNYFQKCFLAILLMKKTLVTVDTNRHCMSWILLKWKTKLFVLSWYYWKLSNTYFGYHQHDLRNWATAQWLLWDAVTKIIGREMKLSFGFDTTFFIENWKWGGISYIAHIYVFTSKIENRKLENSDVRKMHYLSKRITYHHISKVDLECSRALNNMHNDYSVAQEKMCRDRWW